MEEKQVIEQHGKEDVRELYEPEMDKVVGGVNYDLRKSPNAILDVID